MSVKEFELILDWLDKPDKTGKQKILRKNVLLKKQYDTKDILLAEYTNDKGYPIKKYTLLIDTNTNQSYKINMPYEKCKQYIGNIEVKGLMQYSKNK